MAGRTKSDQIAQFVSLPIVAEQVKRGDVVNGQTWGAEAAMLASITVTLAGRAALPCPVFATVANMTTEPSAVSVAAVSDRSPLAKTGAVTEVVFGYCTRNLLDRFTTGIAFDHYALSAHALPVGALPQPIAPHATKVAFGLVGHVRLCRVGLTALLTS
jgi:hypothetical protein